MVYMYVDVIVKVCQYVEHHQQMKLLLNGIGGLLIMSQKKYKIELTDKQLNIYRNALEFYSRFLAGQIDYLPPVLEVYSNASWKEKKQACPGKVDV